jgi:hypothetical protein
MVHWHVVRYVFFISLCNLRNRSEWNSENGGGGKTGSQGRQAGQKQSEHCAVFIKAKHQVECRSLPRHISKFGIFVADLASLPQGGVCRANAPREA